MTRVSSGQPDSSDDSSARPIAVLDAILLSEAGGSPQTSAQRARRRVFSAAGFTVYEAAGAGRIADAVTACSPDVVLLSLDSPLPAGAELCCKLKAPNKKAQGHAPALALLVSAKDLAGFTCWGADLCLPRNLAPAFLVEAIGILARIRRAEPAGPVLELDAALRELTHSRAEMVDFSMRLAHDIEGPLRGVVTFAELIGQAHPLSESEKTYLGHVLSSADQMRRVVRGFLAYAQAKRVPPQLAPVPLRLLVAAAVRNLREQIKESGAEVHIQDALPEILADFSTLQQALQCLIGNAIRYRKPGAGLSIDIGANEGPSGEWTVFVQDNGIGVEAQYREAIFAPFKRLHGAEIPGAGMGLALCKSVVEAHGGRIWVESEPGAGACFRFTLRAPQ